MTENVLVYFVIWLVLLIGSLWLIREYSAARQQQILFALTALVFGLVFVFYILLPLLRSMPT